MSSVTGRPHTADCVFCRIIAGQSPASVFYDDDLVLGLLTIEPINPGHAMVIPKQHASGLEDLNAQGAAAMMPAAQARGRAARVAICAVIIFVAGANLFGEFLPNAKPAETRMTALSSALGAASGPNDLFITSQDVLFDFHLLYFAQRRAIAYAPPAPASEFVVSLARETLKQKGKIYLCNFDAQSLAIFRAEARAGEQQREARQQGILSGWAAQRP